MSEIDFTEYTGPFTRVGVNASSEQEAIDAAVEHLGGSVAPLFTDSFGGGSYTVTFETADLS